MTSFPNPSLQPNTPTVRPTALLDIEVPASPLLLDYTSVPVRLTLLNQDMVSKRTLCLSVAISALKTDSNEIVSSNMIYAKATLQEAQQQPDCCEITC